MSCALVCVGVRWCALVCVPTGRAAHVPQVNPLGQLGAAGQVVSELPDEVLAKVDSWRSTSRLSHFGHWTPSVGAPMPCRRMKVFSHFVHLYS